MMLKLTHSFPAGEQFRVGLPLYEGFLSVQQHDLTLLYQSVMLVLDSKVGVSRQN